MTNYEFNVCIHLYKHTTSFYDMAMASISSYGDLKPAMGLPLCLRDGVEGGWCSPPFEPWSTNVDPDARM